MKNKNTIIIVLLVVIILILSYVAFLKPRSFKNDDQLKEDQNSIANIVPVQKTNQNVINEKPSDSQNYQSYKITIIPMPTDITTGDPHILSVIDNSKKRNANFFGHYVATVAGCGTSCGYPVLYDKNTGNVYRIDHAMVQGSLNEDGSEATDIGWFQTSVSSDIISFKKKAVDGSIYLNQWKLVGDIFMEVQ